LLLICYMFSTVTPKKTYILLSFGHNKLQIYSSYRGIVIQIQTTSANHQISGIIAQWWVTTMLLNLVLVLMARGCSLVLNHSLINLSTINAMGLCVKSCALQIEPIYAVKFSSFRLYLLPIQHCFKTIVTFRIKIVLHIKNKYYPTNNYGHIIPWRANLFDNHEEKKSQL